MIVKNLILCTVCLANLYVTAQALDSDTYVGAVVEFNPKVDNDEEKMVSLNVQEYVNLMREAKKRNADIIVFPEGGLNTVNIMSQIPDPIDRVIPCDDSTFLTTQAVKDLSCASKNISIYSVVNLVEKRACSGENCPPEGFYTYNTNVAFDRSGAVVARYAKFNLFDEDRKNKTPDPEMVFFDTDFGVRFGTFICFDILFTLPAQRLVQQYGITDFVFTSQWFSELPFLTALQAQRGWAETNNVNLLASGYNLPKKGSSGSGIYNGKFGALVEIMPETPTTKLLVANIPKISKKNKDSCNAASYTRFISPKSPSVVVEHSGSPVSTVNTNDDSFVLLHDQIAYFSSEVINNGKKFEQTVCGRNNFCCNFEVSLELVGNNTKEYTHRALVMNGVRHFGQKATGGVQACGIVLCGGPKPADCTKRVKDASGMFKIKHIKIEGDFRSRNAFQMPSTLTDGNKLSPLPAYKYDFAIEKQRKTNKVSLELIWPVSDLYTFAIWGRDITRDGEMPYAVAKASFSAPFSFLCSVISALFLFRY